MLYVLTYVYVSRYSSRMDTNTAAETITANRARGIATGRTETIRLTVTGGESPAATVIALTAPNAVWAAKHSAEMAELSEAELYELLVDVTRLAEVSAALQRRLIIDLRGAGASWARLGAALDTTRSAAKDRFMRATATINRVAGPGFTRLQQVNHRLGLMIAAVDTDETGAAR